MKKILLVRTDKIGDVLLTTPCLKIIKENIPDSEVDFLATSYTAPLFYNNPFVRRVFCLDIKKGPVAFIKLLGELRKENYDVAFLFYVDFFSAALLFLSAIPIRVGPFSKIWSFFLNKRIKQKRSEAVRHEAEYNAELIEAFFGFKHDTLYPLIFLHEDEKKKAVCRKKTQWDTLPAKFRLAGLHPSGRGSNLFLPQEKYFRIIEYLLSRGDCGLLITGTEDEITGYRTRFGRTTGIFIPGNCSLRELISYISLCDIFITNSTGPLHIASALDIKTLSFYSPIRVTRPRRWGPLYRPGNIPYRILLPEEIRDCEKCEGENCRHFNCLSLISSDKIENEIDYLLGQK